MYCCKYYERIHVLLLLYLNRLRHRSAVGGGGAIIIIIILYCLQNNDIKFKMLSIFLVRTFTIYNNKHKYFKWNIIENK